MPKTQLDLIKTRFSDYLNSLGISSKSHKNYRSDLLHFTEWLILRLKSFGSFVETLTETIPFLSADIAHEYKKFMIENKMPVKTINRHLSTLRHLSRFLISSQALDIDFMGGIENISTKSKNKPAVDPIISDFRSYLESQKVSKNTIKNYLSDIHQFLAWIESN